MLSFVEEYRLFFPISLDPEERALLALHDDSLPSSYVVKYDGTVVLERIGSISLSMLEMYLTSLLEN